MTAPQEQQKVNIKEAIQLHLNTLPRADRVSVLAEHIAKIAQDLTLRQTQTIQEALSGIKPDNTEILDLARPEVVYSRREALLEKYKVTLLGSSQVELTLPEGTNRIDFLNEVQALTIALHELEPCKYKSEQAVLPVLLRQWQPYTRFVQVTERDIPLRIDGNVKESTCYSRDEQETRGWNDVTHENLSVAHASFYLLTGKDLFEGKAVRCDTCMLSFNNLGLQISKDFYDADRFSHISASHSLPETN